jgi:chromosome segregation ATPase
MQRILLERRIRDVHTRLVRAREDLAVLDEQLAVVTEEADEARVRSLVSETPLAAHEHSEAARHFDAMSRARAALAVTVVDLEQRQDELLTNVSGGRS